MRISEKSSEVKISGTDPENLIVYRKNGKYLILLLNESRQTEFTAALTLPEGTFREFYSGKTYPGGQTHRFTVPAGKLAALFHDMP